MITFHSEQKPGLDSPVSPEYVSSEPISVEWPAFRLGRAELASFFPESEGWNGFVLSSTRDAELGSSCASWARDDWVRLVAVESGGLGSFCRGTRREFGFVLRELGRR